MLSCQDLLSSLGEYLEDGVSGQVRRQLEEHMAHCHTCEVLVDSARKTLRVVTESGSFEMPAGLSERILARIRAGSEER